MTDKRYNGWVNYETWCANLWLSNDEGSDRASRELAQECFDATDEDDSLEDRRESAKNALEQRLEEEYQEAMPELAGMYSDLLQTAFDAIDWREIAEALLEDAE
jgi:hypothetical protein